MSGVNPGIVIMAVFGLLTTIGVFVMLPELSRPTVPLGVSVPSTRVHDEVVVRAIRRYRQTCLALGGVALIGTLATMAVPAGNALWLLGYVAAGMGAFVWCRRPIMAVKATEHWYAGTQVRVAASATPEPPARVLWPAHVLALLMPLVAVGVTAWAFPTLPDPLPVHFDGAGVGDRFEPKSWWTALQTPILGLAQVMVVATIAIGLARRHDAHLPDGNPEGARQRDARQARLAQTILGVLNPVLALPLAVLAIVPVVKLAPSTLTAVILASVAVSLAVPVWAIVQTARLQRLAQAAPGASGPQSPDDDRYWKAGLFYYNPADRRAWVPKRNGFGLDPNLGHPMGAAFMTLMGLVLVGTIIMVVTL